MACGILVPQPRTEQGHKAVNALCQPNHWTARESPQSFISDNRKWAPLKYCGLLGD